MKKQRKTLGICNGNMEAPTIELFEKIGVTIKFAHREHQSEIDASEGIGFIGRVLRMRPSAIPKNIENNIIDCAVMGLDWLLEYAPKLLNYDLNGGFSPFNIITRLSYARTSRQNARIVIVRKQEKREPHPKKGSSIYAEYQNLAQQIYPEARVVFSDGSTEAEVAKGLYDYGICISETEETIRANCLKFEVLCDSPIVLVSRERTDEIEALGEMLSGVLAAEPMEIVKMNAANQEILDAILNVLTALLSPTVNNLAKGGFAIEAVVPKQNLLDLFINLRARGATGWIQHDLNTVVR